MLLFKRFYNVDDGASGGDGGDTNVAFNPDAFKEDKAFADFRSSIADKAARTTRENLEKQWKEQLATERAKWEEESKLTAKEREEKAKEQYEARLKEREAELFKKEMKLTAIDKLAEQGLSKAFADMVISNVTDDDGLNNNIKALSDYIQSELEKKSAIDKMESVKTPKGKPSNFEDIDALEQKIKSMLKV